MSLIRSLMGRRQFLVAATVTSTAALACKKLARIVDPGLQTAVAMASESSGTAVTKGANNRYSHLLSPIKIRNVIVKNRIMNRVGAPPHFLQGPETYPADVLRIYYSNMAKGAGIVTVRLAGGQAMVSKKGLVGDSVHMSSFDTTDPAAQNYIDQMVEGVHAMGSLVAGGSLGGGMRGGAGPVDIRDIVAQAKKLEASGIDVVGMGVRSLQDKNAVRSAIEQMEAVKNATNLIISMSMMLQDPLLEPEVEDPGSSSLITLDQAIEIAKTFDGHADILLIQVGPAMISHPAGWNLEKDKPNTLRIAQAIKESGVKMLMAPNGGYRDPDLMEEFIAGGKSDMFVLVRPFNADPEYGKKIYEGRGEDVVPCILCNKCHGLSFDGPWFTVCSVNPKLGLESTLKVIEAPTASKKVAVIGGGPAGMKAAIVAAERGHKITLYEKNDYLGGLLYQADFSPFQWPLKDFKDYLIRQVKKAGVEVHLGTAATPDMIKSKGYDVVMVAVGAEPVISRIPGSDSKNVYNVVNVYGKEKELGKNVVVIGGGEFGVETGMYLAKVGHKVTMLTSEKELLQVDRVHYPEIIVQVYEHLENFNYILEVTARNISEGKVTYVDARGNERSIQADSVVIYAGLKPKQDEALKFYSSAKNAFFTIGDCSGKGGNVQRCIRSAFFTASQI